MVDLSFSSAKAPEQATQSTAGALEIRRPVQPIPEDPALDQAEYSSLGASQAQPGEPASAAWHLSDPIGIPKQVAAAEQLPKQTGCRHPDALASSPDAVVQKTIARSLPADAISVT